MTAISLGMPEAPPPVLAPRRPTRQIRVGKVGVGSESPISVQSMTTTLTADVNTTLQQIAELTASGCDIVRVACPSQDDAEALPEIAQHSQIPVIADIHFQPKYVFAAIDAGCAAVRVNPGNIRKFDDQVKEIAAAAKDRGTSIRIGVNAGSLDKRLLEKYGKATPEALVESAVWEAGLFEEHDFHDFKISVKHNDPVVMVRAYEMLAEAGDWPLHLGVTEAGPGVPGHHQVEPSPSATCLSQGIGDTIRVSLSAPPVEEVKVGIQILESLNLKPRRLEIVSCPSCGRAQVDVYKLADEVTAGLDGLEVPLRVAVMGCVVNGPGEAREADLGVASGNGKGQIFVKGEVIKTVPESQIVETLIEEAMRIAEGMETVDGAGAQRQRHAETRGRRARSARPLDVVRDAGTRRDRQRDRQVGAGQERLDRPLDRVLQHAGPRPEVQGGRRVLDAPVGASRREVLGDGRQSGRQGHVQGRDLGVLGESVVPDRPGHLGQLAQHRHLVGGGRRQRVGVVPAVGQVGPRRVVVTLELGLPCRRDGGVAGLQRLGRLHPVVRPVALVDHRRPRDPVVQTTSRRRADPGLGGGPHDRVAELVARTARGAGRRGR